jgi:cytochrome b561
MHLLARVKDEVKHYGLKLKLQCRVWFSAALSAFNILVIEWIVHVLFHGIETIERLNHSGSKSTTWTFPPWMYHTVDAAGIIAFLLYLGRMVVVHANETLAETVKELKDPWVKSDEGHN